MTPQSSRKIGRKLLWDIKARNHVIKGFEKTVKRRPKQLPQQDFTLVAETEGRR